MDRAKKRPVRIDLNEADGLLRITWKDGHQSQFALEELRRTCPCAECRALRGDPGVEPSIVPTAPGELPLLNPTAISATAQVQGFDHVGRYGIRITWADGHNHGIYTFAALRLQDPEAP
ncbi:MAG: DUF971 domain-containing protein [Candidatus Latescibacteria bacterium]|nr:DUF971 domain-containing protein [Candidatus Latescibacterota bacterium]